MPSAVKNAVTRRRNPPALNASRGVNVGRRSASTGSRPVPGARRGSKVLPRAAGAGAVETLVGDVGDARVAAEAVARAVDRLGGLDVQI